MNSENLDLKQRVNLPQTNFSMKANLPRTEPKMVGRWASRYLRDLPLYKRSQVAGWTFPIPLLIRSAGKDALFNNIDSL
jgi:hypothetical protein